MSENRKNGFAILDEILNPDIPEEDRFIPPRGVHFLTAKNAAAARARGLILPWEQL